MQTNYQQLVQAINQAFAVNDLNFLAAHVSDDVCWQISGTEPINGKANFLKCCSEAPFQPGSVTITLNNILVDGSRAACEGIISGEMLNGTSFRQVFCDIYYFENHFIKTLNSYFDAAIDHATLQASALKN